MGERVERERGGGGRREGGGVREDGREGGWERGRMGERVEE